MADAARAFWANLGLGRRRRRPPPRPRRTTVFVVKHETAINRGARLYTFQAHRCTTGDWCAPASVVSPPPGRAAVSTLVWDDDRRRFRCRWLGHCGARYMTKVDTYADAHRGDADLALVIATDCEGTVLYSREL